MHGYVRATTDIDLIVDLQVEEAEKVIKTLLAAGYRPRIPFDDLWQRSQIFEVDGTKIRVCSIDDLLKLKEISGRARDKDDIEKLLQIKDADK
ncbi:MAG: hypothetical protein BMS9Abin19_1057 [Gammaproteobacteria bacterium]|nr:MAG: hypothetical protein BMS9Abin19_1057 [Gammaproteobacteria bacterium]